MDLRLMDDDEKYPPNTQAPRSLCTEFELQER